MTGQSKFTENQVLKTVTVYLTQISCSPCKVVNYKHGFIDEHGYRTRKIERYEKLIYRHIPYENFTCHLTCENRIELERFHI